MSSAINHQTSHYSKSNAEEMNSEYMCVHMCVQPFLPPLFFIFPSPDITELRQKLHMLNLLVLLLPEPNRNTLRVKTAQHPKLSTEIQNILLNQNGTFIFSMFRKKTKVLRGIYKF